MKRAIGLVSLLCGALPLLAQEGGMPAPGVDTPPASQQQGWGAAMGVGAVTMDGKTWTQISLRPDIPIGKLGIALDLTLYFDDKGNVRKADWDEGKDLIDKIYYLRWAHKGDPVYLKAGALDDVTLGYGMLVKDYSNAMQYPAVRRVGGEFDLHIGKPQVEGFLANFRELGDPGLLGLRASYPVIGKLRVGASYLMDGNMYAGMMDDDQDHVPNELDRYQDHDDRTEYQLWHDLQTDLAGNPDLWERMTQSASYPGEAWLSDSLADYSKAQESLNAIGFDIGYELLPKLDLYAQWAKFNSYGSGWAPGLRWRPFSWLQAGAEYRVWGEQFIGEFVNRSYDLERTFFATDSTGHGELLTKREMLASAPAMKGIYADAHLNIFNILRVKTAYNSMTPDSSGGKKWNSLWADAGLDLGKIPKLTELSAYYEQVGVESFSLKTPSTVTGVRLGYELAPGAEMRLNWRTTYVDANGDDRIAGDDETVRTFAVETVFKLK